MPFNYHAAPGDGGTTVIPVNIAASASDLTSAIAVGTLKAYMPPPSDFTITEVGIFLGVAQTSGTLFTVDILKNGVSILSTLITIDNGENYSWDAAAPPVISDPDVLLTDKLTASVTQIGDGTAKALIVMINGEQV